MLSCHSIVRHAYANTLSKNDDEQGVALQLFLSVIIPVYNCEKYIEACLDSLRRQSSRDFEVIIVDDGSQDSSVEICSEFESDDDRFRLFVQDENRGVSAARNVGIKNAKGDYITFMDSDDLWDGSDSVEALKAHIIDSDFPDAVCYNIGEYWSATGYKEYPQEDANMQSHMDVNSFETSIEHMIKRGLYFSSACAKTVRRKIVIENDLYFLEGCAHNEDSDWSCRLLRSINSISWMSKPFYLWRRRSETSQSSKPVSSKTLDDISYILDRNISESEVLDDFRKHISLSFLAYIYVLFMGWAFYENQDSFKEARRHQKEHAWILDYDLNPRVSYAKKAYDLLGYNLTGKLLALVLRAENRRVSKNALKVKTPMSKMNPLS